MSDLTINVLISTYEERLLEVAPVLQQRNPKLRYTLVHQAPSGTDYSDTVTALCEGRNDIEYISIHSKGLAKSRNVALQNAKGDLVVFMDDDVVLEQDFYGIITQAFASMPEADVLTFHIGETGTGELLKDYPKQSIKHHWGTLLRIGSIEMAARLASIKRAGASFPEYLGAGTSLPACEEPVYLSRLKHAGLKLYSFPKIIGYHPKLSSGKVFENEAQFLCRGVAFRDIFGPVLAPVALVYFYLKNYRKFSWAEGSPLKALVKGYFLQSSLKK